jgi:hypothetical protein
MKKKKEESSNSGEELFQEKIKERIWR